MTKECIDITRSLASELSPSVLHQCGLAAGFGWLRDWFGEKYGFNLEVSADESLMPEEDISITLFQCVREIVFNSVKHSSVKSARLTMVCDDDSFVNISIEDQGAGFDAEALVLQDSWKGGVGLFSVRERVELLGGVMLIDSALGQGHVSRCVSLRNFSRIPVMKIAVKIRILAKVLLIRGSMKSLRQKSRCGLSAKPRATRRVIA